VTQYVARESRGWPRIERDATKWRNISAQGKRRRGTNRGAALGEISYSAVDFGLANTSESGCCSTANIPRDSEPNRKVPEAKTTNLQGLPGSNRLLIAPIV